uniref:Uncharacterized protein n=1 Tax=Rhizobium leguminosarum TaxID=384 RepID=A0A154IJV8_RHILE|nr:hypothetical protein A4A59_16830 [Rhizobium leguminosarum]
MGGKAPTGAQGSLSSLILRRPAGASKDGAGRPACLDMPMQPLASSHPPSSFEAPAFGLRASG